jgi:ubiquinone/menaquinone biosynthesis C-methylase UbiE
MLAPRAGERILEIGPGAGYYSLDVASRLLPGGRLDVLDVQPDMLDGLMRRAAADNVENIIPIQGDAQALPFPDDSFDGVFLIAVLGEVPAPGAALREIRRVLKPGGRLVVGEGQPDPHMIALPALKAMADAADLRYDRHEGGRLGYAVRFLAGRAGDRP